MKILSITSRYEIRKMKCPLVQNNQVNGILINNDNKQNLCASKEELNGIQHLLQ